jgi:hypothetical protein
MLVILRALKQVRRESTIPTMVEQRNTVVCTFDPSSTKMSAKDIREWIQDIFANIGTRCNDDPGRRAETESIHQNGGRTNRTYTPARQGEQAEYKLNNGIITVVKLDIAGMKTKIARIPNLPPEVPDEILKSTFTSYGNVVAIWNETWSRAW